MNAPTWFCVACHAPKHSSYRALGAKCENPTCSNANDGSARTFWIHRDELPPKLQETRA